MLLQRVTLIRRVAHAELELRRAVEPPVGEIAARLGAQPRSERRLEKLCRNLHHVMQRLAFLLALNLVLGVFRQRHASHGGEPFDGLGKRDALGLHHEIEDVAVLAG